MYAIKFSPFSFLFSTKQTRKRSPSPYSGASDYSRSSTPDSFRLASNSSSVSRSHSPSGSSYSGSPSRSRSRSPIASHRTHRSKKHRSRRHKVEKAKSREKGKERKSGHHHSSRKKRKRHLSPESEERLSKSHHPERKKHRDNIALSALVEDDLLSAGSSLPSGALSPEMDLDSQGTASSSHRKHRHKKRSKAKHSRRRVRSDEEMEMDRSAGGDVPTDYPVDINLEEADRDTLRSESVKDVDSGGKGKLSENEGAGEESKEDKVISESGGVAMAEADSTLRTLAVSLVPYHDSSATETEGREREEEHPTHAAAVGGNVQDNRPGGGASSKQSSKQRPGSTSSTSNSGSMAGDEDVNDAIEELEAAMKESTAAADSSAVKSDGGKATVKEGADGSVKGDEGIDEGAPPTAAVEGEEGEETMEDSLMIALHVDEDAIDQDSAELLDAECPNKGIPLVILPPPP